MDWETLFCDVDDFCLAAEPRLRQWQLVDGHRDGGMVCCLLEMDLGTMNVKRIRQKYRRYAAWIASQAGQQYLIDLYRSHGAQSPRPTFRLLMIARDRSGQDDHRRLRELYAAAKGLPAAMQDRLWFASVTDLQT